MSTEAPVERRTGKHRIIGVMVHSFARVGAVFGMNVEDYFQQGKRWWFRLHEKGDKRHGGADASQRRGLS